MFYDAAAFNQAIGGWNTAGVGVDPVSSVADAFKGAAARRAAFESTSNFPNERRAPPRSFVSANDAGASCARGPARALGADAAAKAPGPFGAAERTPPNERPRSSSDG